MTYNKVITQFLWITALVSSVSMISLPANAALIEVTTTEDSFGQDDTTCSLREAIQASLTKKPFGGCVEGERNVTDVIKLEDKTYQLTEELKIERQIDRFFRTLRIDGSDFFDPTEHDSVTGKINKRLLPKPTIVAAAGQRVFNTAGDAIPLALNNVNIQGSGSSKLDLGGVFLVGGSLSLNNVTVKNGYAKRGGAIFLEGPSSALDITRTLLENNKAEEGAALAANCFDDLNPESLSIEITRSSIVNNSVIPGGKVPSIIRACAAPVIKVTNTSMVGNDSGSQGALIEFSDKVRNAGRVTPRMTINFSTLSGNTNGIRYSELSSLNVTNSVLAFNTNYDCQFKQSENADAVTLDDAINVSISQTLMTGEATRPKTNGCVLRQLTDAKADTNNSYVPKTTVAAHFEVSGSTVEALDYGLGLKGLLPKIPAKETVSGMLIQATGSRCQGEDMRGLSRVTTDAQTEKSCYKGAIERGRLIAVNDSAESNQSYVDFVKRLEDRINDEPRDGLTDKQLNNFNKAKKQDEALLKAYKDSYDAEKNKDVPDFTGFRQAYVSVLDNDIPFEDSSGKIKLFPYLQGLNKDGNFNVVNSKNYDVTVDIKKSGNGSAEKDKVNDENAPVSCRWDKNLQQIIIWRTDGSVTPAGSSDYCSYKITSVNDQNQKVESEAFAKARITNIAPVAEDLTIQTSGTEPKVIISLDDSINDDGDGTSRPATNGIPIVPEFYQDNNSALFIEIIKPPELGRLVFSENGGEGEDCPNPNASQVNTNKCFGGQITYIRNNLDGKFDDSFTYRVYDGGTSRNGLGGGTLGSLPSNTAKVSINADRRNGTATSVFSGGGSVSWLAMLGLFGLCLLRMTYAYKSRAKSKA